MGYLNLGQCVEDLERTGQLVRVEEPLDTKHEVAAFHRRVFQSGGPALLFTAASGTDMPLLSNLFGTKERARFLFRDTWQQLERLLSVKADPHSAIARPWRHLKLLPTVSRMRPKRTSRAAVLEQETTIGNLPQIVHWPKDGGAFITLPLVYTEDPQQPGHTRSNLGMYRIQLSGGEYRPDREIGMHYQIHRGIGVHHASALANDVALPVNIYVGGSPAMILSAVMPLPEGMSELTFAGALGGHRIPLAHGTSPLPIYAQADVCIQGRIVPNRLLPEGPFGDHLGYYSLAHNFPVLEVLKVTRRKNAIWPFTVVGRPPQEDSMIGDMIHELTAPVIPTVVPGIHEVHAVDAAGVHPLLLAIGSERYTPFQPTTRPQELLTQANAVLGQGQMSLAKYLWIINRDDDPAISAHDLVAFLRHLLERIDFERDLHFHTCTTIDTLDYSGENLNQGSKVIWAAVGPSRRTLPKELPAQLSTPAPFGRPMIPIPGVLLLEGPPAAADPAFRREVEQWCDQLNRDHPINTFPLIVLVDDSEFTAKSLENLLWVTFTRSDPALDTYGIESFYENKHWGCRGSMVIDARLKPHHAPALEEDDLVSKKLDAIAARGGPLARFL